MALTDAEAIIVWSGRCPLFWNYLNSILGDTDWNNRVNAYNDIEIAIGNNTKTGIDSAPIRPNPQPRP